MCICTSNIFSFGAFPGLLCMIPIENISVVHITGRTNLEDSQGPSCHQRQRARNVQARRRYDLQNSRFDVTQRGLYHCTWWYFQE
jgi:hypothetical protein